MIIKNTIANTLSQVLYPLISIVLVPFYLTYLGAEAYGLISFYVLIETLLSVFTKGVGSAFLREVAVRDASDEGKKTLPNIVRTYETLYWAAGIIFGITLVIFSGFMSARWIKSETIPVPIVKDCLMLLSLRIAIALPKIIYQATLVGLQRQIIGNVLDIISTTLSSISMVVVIILWNSILGFFITQLFFACFNLLLFRYWLTKKVLINEHPAKEAKFEIKEVINLWRISLNMIWVNGVNIIMSQLDRLFITTVLPIAALGIYNIGTSGGRLINIAFAPFLVAAYPQTIQIAAKGGITDLYKHLMRNLKVILILSLSAGLPLSFFSEEILTVWVKKPDLVSSGKDVMMLYTFGNILLSCSSVFYLGQKALGDLKYMSFSNAMALLWYPVAIWFLLKYFGLKGATLAWVLYCCSELLFSGFVTIKYIFKGQYDFSDFYSIALSVFSGVLLVLLARYSADYLYSDFIWIRLLIALLGAASIFVTSYLIFFGVKIPAELNSFYKRLSI